MATIQKFAVGKILSCLLCSPRLHLFGHKYSKKCNTVKKNFFFFLLDYFIMSLFPVVAKLNFQQEAVVSIYLAIFSCIHFIKSRGERYDQIHILVILCFK